MVHHRHLPRSKAQSPSVAATRLPSMVNQFYIDLWDGFLDSLKSWDERLWDQHLRWLTSSHERMASMCSGTECISLCMDGLEASLARRGIVMNWTHVLSAEWETSKNSFIVEGFPFAERVFFD
eukprot:175884-Alexandrium_andersonii.AAC.1